MKLPLAGLQLAVLGWALLAQLGHAEAEMAARSTAALAKQHEIDETMLEQLAQEAYESYEADRGAALIAAAFPQSPA